jgi:hypothetical protein
MKLYKIRLLTFLLLLCIFGMVALFAGCMTSQKAVDFLKKKKELPIVCDTEYPVKEKYIKGDSIIITDTIYEGENNFYDTTINYVSDTITKIITKTLPSKTIYKTIYRTDTVVKESTANLDILKNEKAELQRKYDIDHDYRVRDEKKHKGKATIYIPIWLIIALCSVSALLIFTWLKTKALNPIKLFTKK